MDRDNRTRRDNNPRKNANILSLVTFFYTIKLYIKAYTAGLELSDIYEVLPNCSSKELAENLDQEWQKERESKQSPSICRAVWFCHGKSFITIGFMQFIATMVITTWSPKALSKLISFFSPGQNDLTKQDAVFYACLVIGINLTDTLIKRNFGLILSGIGIRVKAAVASLLYRKSLKVHSESLSKVTAGKIVTIISKDVDLLESFFRSGNDVWIAVIQTGLVCFLIYDKIGLASLPGIIFFLVVLPIQVAIGLLTYRYRLKCSKKSDERLELIREVLSASKIIKMYTWETFFEGKIHEARKQEMKKLHKMYYANVWITVIGNICSKVAFFLFMMTYVWRGNNVSAETVYYILSCFNDLEGSLSNGIPSGVSLFAKLFAVTERIESVLEAPELPPREKCMESKPPEIVLKEVTVQIHERKILENISLSISEGLNIIVGHTGSGKTSFLKAILKETQTSGDVIVNGRISYTSQEPWLFPSTIKNNILFGEEYDEKRYNKVLKICSLEYDLDLLADGDHTVIGESGVNLSKGQQARINLARTVYKNSDIYLLDDCLASLDANVSDAIFEDCICQFLKNKLCLFVANNSDHIQKADKVIVVDSGSVTFKENFERFQSLVEETTSMDNFEVNVKNFEVKPLNKQIYYEAKKPGRVPLRDYVRYIQHGGGIIIFIFLVGLFIISQSTSSYSDKVLSRWVTLEENLTNHKGSNKTYTLEYATLYQEKTHELSIYTAMITITILLTLIKCFSFYHFVRRASISLHKTMVHSVINSTMKFFDTHFIGNVLNRFSKDFEAVDSTIPFVAMDILTMIFTASGGVILLTTVNYIFLLESLLLLIAACAVKEFCQPAGRNLERLHVIARSPLTGHLNSTLEGLATIRASNAQETLTKEFDRHQDLFTSAYFMVVTNFLAMSVFFKYVCIIFTAIIIFQFLLSDIGGSIGDVGLAITQAFVITNIISSGILSVADGENLMISIERVLEYTDLEIEDENGEVTIGWPNKGLINFSNVSLNYGNNQMLSDINFVINPTEKIGIVGRTGAGKSSIISSLFRLYPTKGIITIDDIDIKNVSLTWLRSNISVIPQDPYLFSGTIRENLDPLNQHQDDHIWKILKELQVDHLIRDLNMKIDRGSSFSGGQKQLLCLSRAILRKSKIVILDEATANVDHETENFIEEMIRKYFSDSTLLIIAHKPVSVLNCNKIMVLKDGRIDDFDETKKLLQKVNNENVL